LNNSQASKQEVVSENIFLKLFIELFHSMLMKKAKNYFHFSGGWRLEVG